MSETTGLYRLFSSSGFLLYVGIAGNPGRRFQQHARDKMWWGEVSKIELEHFADRQDAREAESDAIANENPRYNIQGIREEPVPVVHAPPIVWGNQMFDLDVYNMGKEHKSIPAPPRKDPWMGQNWERSPFYLYVTNRKKWVDIDIDYSGPFSYQGSPVNKVVQAFALISAVENNEDQFSIYGSQVGSSLVIVRFPIEIANFCIRAFLLAEQGDGSWTEVIESAVHESMAYDFVDWNWNMGRKVLSSQSRKIRTEIANYINQNLPYANAVAA